MTCTSATIPYLASCIRRSLLLVLLLLLIPVPAHAVVTLVSFSATAGDGQVLLRWETATEINSAGFFIRRSTHEEGEYARISPFIASQGDSLIGAPYSYVDADVQNGITYFYKLEAMESDQDVEFFGPVWATPGGTPTPTETATAVPTSTPTLTHTPGLIPTSTPTPTDTSVPTHTPSPILTALPTDTPTSVPTPIPTDTPEPMLIPTAAAPTDTATPLPAPIATRTPSPIHTPSPASTTPPTDTPTSLPTPAATHTPVPTYTPSPIPTMLPTATATVTPSRSLETSPAVQGMAAESGPAAQPSSHRLPPRTAAAIDTIQPSPSPSATHESPSPTPVPDESPTSRPDPALALRQTTVSLAPSGPRDDQGSARDRPASAIIPQNRSMWPGDWTALFTRGLLSLVALVVAGGLFVMVRRGGGR